MKQIIILVSAVFLSACSGFKGFSGASGNSGQGMPVKCGSQINLTWTAPTKNSDGSALTNLAGFKIYYGNSSRNYPNVVNVTDPKATTYQLSNLPPGPYYLALTAYNSVGGESVQSNEADIRLLACMVVYLNISTGRITASYSIKRDRPK